MNNNSFTLVELLIVIGILAILTAAVVVVLNPAELLKQARDSKRLQDLTSIDKSLQVSQAIYPDISLGTASTVYVSIADTTSTCANIGLPTLPSGWSYNCVTSANLINSDGTGWIPVNFQDTNLVGAVQLSALPIDPINTTSTGLYYTYAMGGSWQITSLTESEKYATNAANDGGQDPAMYEKGSDLTLTPFAHGLVGWWKFDESSGTTAIDSSGHGNNGTMYSSSTPTLLTTASGCKLGRCLSLDGTDDYVGTSHTSSLQFYNTGTFSLWYKGPLSSSGSRQIIGYEKDSHGDYSQGFALMRNGDHMRVYWKSGGEVVDINQFFLEDETWVHISFVNNNGSIQLYKDGSLVGNGTSSGALTVNDFSIMIGGAITSYFVSGSIDDVRIYNRALSASEIEAIYNATQ